MYCLFIINRVHGGLEPLIELIDSKENKENKVSDDNLLSATYGMSSIICILVLSDNINKDSPDNCFFLYFYIQALMAAGK